MGDTAGRRGTGGREAEGARDATTMIEETDGRESGQGDRVGDMPPAAVLDPAFGDAPERSGDRTPGGAGGDLVLDLNGYEGPLDVLLTLARDQKVDLTRISILQLADQYLGFVERARRLHLEIAAEYLVMAAWLAYLKSRLLLPREEEPTDEPTGPELAEALAFHLRRLEAMQEAGVRIMARPLLGRDVFPRGEPDGIKVVTRVVYDVSLYDLLKAYASHRRRSDTSTFTIEALDLFSVEDAMERLVAMLGGGSIDWRTLMSFLPDEPGPPLKRRSAVASTLLASLELVRSGQADMRQNEIFGPIFLKSAARPS